MKSDPYGARLAHRAPESAPPPGWRRQGPRREPARRCCATPMGTREAARVTPEACCSHVTPEACCSHVTPEACCSHVTPDGCCSHDASERQKCISIYAQR